MRNVIESDLVGKTIKSVNVDAANVIQITFSDDTSLDLLAEIVVMTNDGVIPGILVAEPGDLGEFVDQCSCGEDHDH